MSSVPDLDAVARGIIDDNQYMVLGTADASGSPWASPVWFASDDYRRFIWLSSPEARHSRNVAARPDIGIVIFDSRVAIGTGQAVYMAAVAEELSGDDLERGMDTFSRRSIERGGREWRPEQAGEGALHRLYRATASQHWVLAPAGHPDHRPGIDHRTPVHPSTD